MLRQSHLTIVLVTLAVALTNCSQTEFKGADPQTAKVVDVLTPAQPRAQEPVAQQEPVPAPAQVATPAAAPAPAYTAPALAPAPAAPAPAPAPTPAPAYTPPPPPSPRWYNFVSNDKALCEASIVQRLGISAPCTIGGGCSNFGPPTAAHPSANPTYPGACLLGP